MGTDMDMEQGEGRREHSHTVEVAGNKEQEGAACCRRVDMAQAAVVHSCYIAVAAAAEVAASSALAAAAGKALQVRQ